MAHAPVAVLTLEKRVEVSMEKEICMLMKTRKKTMTMDTLLRRKNLRPAQREDTRGTSGDC